MKTIMVATDFSERSDRALRRATFLAKQADAKIVLVHVVDDDQPRRIVLAERDIRERLLEELAASVRQMDGVECSVQLLLADPFEGIAQATKTANPDLLILGPHRRQALRDVFIGTTAERTIRSVTCPVLMVNAAPVGAYRRVLATTDFSQPAEHALETFHGLGLGADAGLVLLNVFDAPALDLAMGSSISTIGSDKAYIEEERQRAGRKLTDYARQVTNGPVQPIARHRQTTIATEILSAASEQGADLIVVGTESRTGLAKLLLGSVAEKVLREAERDVLAVPPASVTAIN